MPDAHAAAELKLYIDNDGDLYRRQTTSILKNLVTKRARGIYKHPLAVKLFGYLTEEGAKKYAREFGSPSQPWHRMFDVGTRKMAAEALTRAFEAEVKLGNYDHLLPKKYQAQKTTGHARKKAVGGQSPRGSLRWKTPEGLKISWSPVNQAYFALWPGRGRIEDQQVLKVGSADEMQGWLRDTYGGAYGLAGRTSSGHFRKKSAVSRGPRFAATEERRRALSAARERASLTNPGISAQDIREFRGFLQGASDSQVQGIYEKEKRAGREEYAELAVAEASQRGLSLEGPYGEQGRKSHARIKQEVDQILGSRGYRS